MRAVDSVRLIADLGMEEDSHARAGSRRQVLLMEQEALQRFGLEAGAVRENITTRGIELMKLGEGGRLRVGDAELEITGECHPCSRMDEIRPGLQEALQGQRGVVARVISGGVIRVGDTVQH